MITLKKLLERAKSEQIAIHIPTEEQAKTLLKALDEKGYEWISEKKLTDITYYEYYRENTCYVFGIGAYGNLLNKKVVFSSLKFHQEVKKVVFSSLKFHQEVGYTIIEFADIDFEDK